MRTQISRVQRTAIVAVAAVVALMVPLLWLPEGLALGALLGLVVPSILGGWLERHLAQKPVVQRRSPHPLVALCQGGPERAGGQSVIEPPEPPRPARLPASQPSWEPAMGSAPQ